MRAAGIGAGIVLGVVVGAGAMAQVYTDKQSAYPCNREAVYARTVNLPPSDTGYYMAQNCETVYADRVTVVLPTLSGQTEPQRVTIRNVGPRTIIVGARQPADSIDPMVQKYINNSTPVLNDGDGYLLVPPQSAITVIAMPSHLPNAWFVESRANGALTFPKVEGTSREGLPKPADRVQ